MTPTMAAQMFKMAQQQAGQWLCAELAVAMLQVSREHALKLL
jgi:hypothetical protein